MYIDRIEQFKDWVKGKREIFLDVETVDTKVSKVPMDIHAQKLVLLQLGDKHEQFLFTKDFLQLKEILENIICIGHNIKYDYKILKSIGIELSQVKDTMIQEICLTLSSKREDGYYSLKETHFRYTGRDPYSEQLSLFDPYIPKSLRNDFSNLTEAHLSYAKTDLITTNIVYEHQLPLIAQAEMEKLISLENQFVLVLGDMEYSGMYIDQDRWLELEEYSKEKLEEALAKLNSYKVIDNWNSSKQVAPYFKELGIDISVIDRNKSEKEGELIYKDSIQELVISKYAEDYPVVKDYLKFKALQKLNSSYGIKFLRLVSPLTNRIHSNYQQIVSTGRTASSRPNLQNIISSSVEFPEGIWWREAFKAEKGNSLVIADYSSQELFVVASKSGDSNMISTLQNKGDLHKLAAAALFEKPIEEVSGEERKKGKTVNFASIYGAGPSKISEYFKVSSSKARTMLDGYFKMFPKLKEFQESSFSKAIEKGYIKIDKLGRRHYISDYKEFKWLHTNIFPERVKKTDLKKKYGTLKSKIFRASANYPVQGEAASMIKLAMILLRKRLRKYQAKIIGLVHDEIIVECLTEHSKQVAELVLHCMRLSARYFCSIHTLTAEVKISDCWNK